MHYLEGGKFGSVDGFIEEYRKLVCEVVDGVN